MIASLVFPFFLMVQLQSAKTDEVPVATVNVGKIKAEYLRSKGLTITYGDVPVSIDNQIVVTSPTEGLIFDSKGKEPVCAITKLGTEGKILNISFHAPHPNIPDITEKVEIRPDNSIVMKLDIDWTSKASGIANWLVADLDSKILNDAAWHAECTDYSYPKGTYFSEHKASNKPETVETVIVKNFWTLDILATRVRMRVAPSQDSADLIWTTSTGMNPITAVIQPTTALWYRHMELTKDSSNHKTVRIDLSKGSK